MIDLTPLEVRRKKGDFPRSMRGYQRDLVDDFLELAADRLEELNHENIELRDRVARLEEELAAFRDRDEALTGALVSAQEARNRMERDANKEAELIRQRAEVEADKARAAAATAREREMQGLRQLRARRTEMIRSYRDFLERELKELGVLSRTLELEDAEEAAAGSARKGKTASGKSAAGTSSSGGSGKKGESGAASSGADDAGEPGSLLSSIVEEEK